MSWLVRPPVELIFIAEGIGVVAVMAAVLILLVRGAKREQVWIGTDNPKVYGALREGSVVVLERPVVKPGQLHGIELDITKIKWLKDGKAATIYAGDHRFQVKEKVDEFPL